jgi:hypothetical protein
MIVRIGREQVLPGPVTGRRRLGDNSANTAFAGRGQTVVRRTMDVVDLRSCTHRPACPPAEARDAAAARVVADCQEQGWSLLCNGVVSFDDLAALRPDGTVCGCA